MDRQGCKKKILLIDDEVSLCKFTKRNLERQGNYEVEVAHSGTEGVEKAQTTKFDLVITDYKMPGMDGKAVLDFLKAKNPRSPVVLFSIYHDDDDKITNDIMSKADGVISKPIDNEQLHKVVKDALAKSEGGT